MPDKANDLITVSFEKKDKFFPVELVSPRLWRLREATAKQGQERGCGVCDLT